MKLKQRLTSVTKILILFAGLYCCGCKKKPSSVPALTTSFVTSSIQYTSINCGGNVTADGGGEVTERGVCWGTNPAPAVEGNKTSNGSGTGIFTTNLTNLTPNTKYYIRAYATNSKGTGYGNEGSFITTGPLTDQDGNIYQTKYIGEQAWMTENLKTTKYNDGTSVSNVTDSTQWSNLPITTSNFEWNLSTGGAYCDYNNDANNSATNGRLYNWESANNPLRRLCPSGWHVPSFQEWDMLSNEVTKISEGYGPGGKLKESGTLHWAAPNTGADNSSGFTALPAGFRFDDGSFNDIGIGTGYWTSSGDLVSGNPGTTATYYYLSNSSEKIYGNKADKKIGFSIRCIRD